MNCTNCGAPMEPVAGGKHFHCAFCASVSVPQKTEEGIVDLGKSAQHSCPVCQHQLTQATIEQEPIEYCNQCHGFLIPRPSFSQLIERLRSRYGGEKLAPAGIHPEEHNRTLKCPICNGEMELHPYFGPGNVMLDSCHDCHVVWLDHQEMTIIKKS